MADLYGIQAVIKPSISETPIKINTEVVFIGCAQRTGHQFEPVKVTSMADYREKYTTFEGGFSLEKSAQYAFEYCNLDHAWFINCNDAVTTHEIGKSAELFKAGAEALDRIFDETGVVPSLVVLPMNNQHETPSAIATAVAAKCKSINGKFKAQLVYDNVITDSDLDEITLAGVSTGNYKLKTSIVKNCSEGNCICCLGDGITEIVNYVPKTIPGSVIWACTRAKQDMLNAGEVPSRSCGNLRAAGIIKYQASTIMTDIQQVNNKPLENDIARNDALAAAGFAILANKGQRKYHIWGDHTAMVSGDGAVDDELYRFDSNIAIAYHIANRAILKWQDSVDSPMNLNLRNLIIMEEQSYLDYLIGIGALIGGAKCEFRADDNRSDTLGLGQFYFTNVYTTAIPAKYIQFNLVWTAEGLSSLVA